MIRVRCPLCGRMMQGQGRVDWPEWPFCSPRCRLRDLGRWLGEEYRLAAGAADDSSGDEDDPPKPAAPSAVPNREEA